MMHVPPKFALILPGIYIPSLTRKKIGKVSRFSWNHDVWMFDVSNENDGMHQFIC